MLQIEVNLHPIVSFDEPKCLKIIQKVIIKNSNKSIFLKIVFLKIEFSEIRASIENMIFSGNNYFYNKFKIF